MGSGQVIYIYIYDSNSARKGWYEVGRVAVPSGLHCIAVWVCYATPCATSRLSVWAFERFSSGILPMSLHCACPRRACHLPRSLLFSRACYSLVPKVFVFALTCEMSALFPSFPLRNLTGTETPWNAFSEEISHMFCYTFNMYLVSLGCKNACTRMMPAFNVPVFSRMFGSIGRSSQLLLTIRTPSCLLTTSYYSFRFFW